MKTQPVAQSNINSPKDLIGRHVTIEGERWPGKVLGLDPINGARVRVKMEPVGSEYSVHWLQLHVVVEG